MATHKCNQEYKISTLEANHSNMANDIREIKELQKEQSRDFKELKDYIQIEFPKTFATKEQLKEVDAKVEKVDGKFWVSIGSIISLLVGSLGYLLAQYFQK